MKQWIVGIVAALASVRSAGPTFAASISGQYSAAAINATISIGPRAAMRGGRRVVTASPRSRRRHTPLLA